MHNIILKMQDVRKEFPGVVALDNVHLNVYKGKIMALLGENGAGKSTLMKVMTGVYKKTDGSIYYKGDLVNYDNPKESQDAGIAIIHQELNLINDLSIAENIFIGREFKNKFGKINWKKTYYEASKLLKELGLEEDPKTLLGKLSIGKQQLVEIAKALSLKAELIILDEPTDALTDTETESLFKVMRKLKEQGKSMVYISHRLEEIFEICDDITILRDGKFIVEKEIENIDQDKMIEYMVGRKLEEQFPTIKHKSGKILFEVKNLNNKYLSNINFNIKEGEILGVAGLMGAGRTELAKTIYGAYKIDFGEMYLENQKLRIKSPEGAVKNKIAYVSEDRKKDELILGLSVKENIHIGALDSIKGVFGFLNSKKESDTAYKYVESMSIKTPSINQLVKNLSGGNQQKIAIAKNLITEPKLLILDEPTRGVDVGAKKEIYDLINEYKKQGIAILMISSEILEVLAMSDRILVMHEGKISGELEIENATQEKIMELAVGIKGGKND
ncbi:MAG: ATP-binding cassette domain-containing protein [Bacillota bacterium]|nr:ATP-binding cassette domain-containing protein [Bacillota bacterium]